jgi:hypothetical protein
MNLKKIDISHYLYPCYILLKNIDMLPGKKKVRGLEGHPDKNEKIIKVYVLDIPKYSFIILYSDN